MHCSKQDSATGQYVSSCGTTHVSGSHRWSKKSVAEENCHVGRQEQTDWKQIKSSENRDGERRTGVLTLEGNVALDWIGFLLLAKDVTRTIFVTATSTGKLLDHDVDRKEDDERREYVVYGLFGWVASWCKRDGTLDGGQDALWVESLLARLGGPGSARGGLLPHRKTCGRVIGVFAAAFIIAFMGSIDALREEREERIKILIVDPGLRAQDWG